MRPAPRGLDRRNAAVLVLGTALLAGLAYACRPRGDSGPSRSAPPSTWFEADRDSLLGVYAGAVARADDAAEFERVERMLWGALFAVEGDRTPTPGDADTLRALLAALEAARVHARLRP